MTGYLDSSVVLRWIFNHDSQYKKIKKYSEFIASDILIIECNRVLERYRLESLLKDDELIKAKKNLYAVINGINFIELDSSIKKRAADSFPTIIGTLDSIHLSTALLYKEEKKLNTLTVISHDKQLINCAVAMGFTTDGLDVN